MINPSKLMRSAVSVIAIARSVATAKAGSA